MIWQVGTNAVFRNTEEFRFRASLRRHCGGACDRLSKIPTDVILMDFAIYVPAWCIEKKPLSEAMVKRDIAQWPRSPRSMCSVASTLMEQWHIGFDRGSGRSGRYGYTASERLGNAMRHRGRCSIRSRGCVEAAAASRRTTEWGGIDKICRSSVSRFQNPFGYNRLPTQGRGICHGFAGSRFTACSA